MSYDAPPDMSSSTSPTATTERSVKSCYAVVYHLSPDRKWIVSGEGGWSEVHLCCDSMDMSHRLLAWTVKNQSVLLNANVTADCTYKEKSKNFHSFQDENGQRFGLGFHKSDSGLRQAEHFVSAVVHVINECKQKLAEMEAFSLAASEPGAPPPPLSASTTAPGTIFGVAIKTPASPSAGRKSAGPGFAGGASSSSSSGGGGSGGGPPPLPPGIGSKSVSSASPRPMKTMSPRGGGSSYSMKKLTFPTSSGSTSPTPATTSTATSSASKSTSPGPPKPPPVPAAARAMSVARPMSPPPLPSAAKLRTTKSATSPRKGFGLPKFKSSPAVADTSSALTTTRSYADLSPEEELALIPTEHTTRGYSKEAPKGVPKLGVLQIHAPKTGKMGSKHDSKISDVRSVERKLMVVYDQDSGTFEGLPAEWKKVLAKQFGVPARLLPGTKIPSYPAKIPTVLITLKKALKDAGGYEQTGIFRLAPSAEVNDAVKAAINDGRFDFSGSDVNVYANLIKVWFRDLPKALLACANPDQVESAYTEADVVKCIADFPEPNKSIFLWLCDMCVEVAAYERTNKMGPKNLAIVIGPNLFDASVFDNPMRAMTYSGKIVDFFEKAIVWRRGSES